MTDLSDPRFSVVVPAFNAQDTLDETLRSIRDQTFVDWECVVVDDGSTDETAKIAGAMSAADSRFVLLKQANRGTGGAYNTGVRSAQGQWVMVCSADDLLLPEHLRNVDDAIRDHPDLDVISTNGYFLKPDASRVLVYGDAPDGGPRSWSMEDLIEKCFFSVGAAYRRSLFAEIGGYDEQAYGEDYDFWLRAMADGARHLYLPAPTAIHRLSATQKSASYLCSMSSDIRSIRAVLRSGKLTSGQRAVARRAIRDRKRVIRTSSEAVQLLGRVRRRVRAVVGRGDA